MARAGRMAQEGHEVLSGRGESAHHGNR
ncbi:Protein of unknown function [Propionibacterium freudenreichii]|nr:Protein of unknown function [Propionibacterium freudenreichii]CEI47097.1 Protein of unknown function [Propionibacterium freudenreichii]